MENKQTNHPADHQAEVVQLTPEQECSPTPTSSEKEFKCPNNSEERLESCSDGQARRCTPLSGTKR